MRVLAGTFALLGAVVPALAQGPASAPSTPADAIVTKINTILSQRGSLHRKQLELSVAISNLSPAARATGLENILAQAMPVTSPLRLEWRLRTEIPAIRTIDALPLEVLAGPDGIALTADALAPAQLAQLGRRFRKLTAEALDERLLTEVADALITERDLVVPLLGRLQGIEADDSQKAEILVEEIASAAGTPLSADGKSAFAANVMQSVDNWRKRNAQVEARSVQLAQNAQRLQQEFQLGIGEIQKRVEQTSVTISELSVTMAKATAGNDVKSYVSAFRQSIGLLESNGVDVSFMRKAVLGKMTGGDLIDLGDRFSDRKNAYTQISITRANLAAEMQGYLGDVAAVGGVLAKAGVLSRKDAAKVEKGVQLASAAANIAAAYASGNVVGAVMGAAGLFGGGGADAGAQRHAEIIANQQRILQGIDELLKGQAQILRAAQHIIDLQHKTLEAIVALSEQMQRNQEQLLTRLDALEYRQVNLQVALIELIGRDLRRCGQLAVLSQSKDYLALRAAFDQRRTDFDTCTNDGISNHLFVDLRIPRSHLDQAARVGTYFLLRTHPAKAADGYDELVAYERRVKQVRDYFEAAYPTNPDPVAARLMQPAGSVEELTEMVDGALPEFTLIRVFKDPLNHSAVLDASRAALLAHALYELRNSTGSLADFGTTDAAHPPLPDYGPRTDPADPDFGFSLYDGRRALQKAARLVDLAIGQQALLSGDALLFAIDRARDQKATHDLLRDNEIIARNYVMFALKRAAPGPTGIAAYRLAFDAAEKPAFMEGIAPGYRFGYHPEGDAIPQDKCGGRRFGQVPKGWYLAIGDCVRIPLPPPTAVAEGRLELTAAMHGLLAERKRLAQALAAYEFADVRADGKPVIPEDLYRYAALRALF
ncbi:hypothetical protein [Bradyrhizobium japonicum]|uniref:hypothetical protein n=1 Tax=Bradyrhizobium japonicum TaxID=375 RepID=UPI00209DEAE7|nr:hypothetical protein [Bradyrhizobium japonicum]MCP1783892.1 hypothetical protein [Bradyrhizobium japonicum]MCP1963820.1 hypothetical protein [Bradyrhizobium japonicum]